MQKFFILTLLTLVGCTPTTPTALPTASLTSAPTATATVIATPTETPTLTPEPTYTPEPTPTLLLSLRPDFESMTDEQLLQNVEEWGKFFADQVDCSLGIQGLPTPTNSLKLVEADQPGFEVFWRTEFLGSYKNPLKDKDGLSAGPLNCLYFASSEPGGVFTIYGGGMLWGEDLLVSAYSREFGLPSIKTYNNYVNSEKLLTLLEPGKEYELKLPGSSGSWPSFTKEDKIWYIRYISDIFGYVPSVNAITLLQLENYDPRLPFNYPATNNQKLINNPSIPVHATLKPAGGE